MPSQKWEYALIQTNTKTFLCVDGKTLHAEFAEMGQQGWELVTTERMNGHGEHDVLLIFKRPRNT